MSCVKHHASPLWTLQRPRFEPDVATGLSDRGENREPGAATEAIRMQLTTEMRLENGPRLRRISSSASAKWSGAADRQAAILNAQGSAEAIRLEGEARANVLRLNVEGCVPMHWSSSSSEPIGGTAYCPGLCSTGPGSYRFSDCHGRTMPAAK